METGREDFAYRVRSPPDSASSQPGESVEQSHGSRVGLQHNPDVSFIATKWKVLALVFCLTNYATKVEDPVWRRAAAAKEVLETLGERVAGGESHPEGILTDSSGKENKTRQLLMRVANRVFTERALSQVEVVAYLLG